MGDGFQRVGRIRWDSGQSADCPSGQLYQVTPDEIKVTDSLITYRLYLETRERRKMKTLLAIDDSPFSEAALQAVIAQNHSKATEVKVLHVVEPPSLLVACEMGGYDASLEAVWDQETKQARTLVAKAAEALSAHGFKATVVVKQGDPKSMIIDVATEWNADLIVLGSHGRKALDRFLMGGVSEATVRHAPCSVEVVRISAGH
jgi:nucleotide-binding universal stress UspA family protein